VQNSKFKSLRSRERLGQPPPPPLPAGPSRASGAPGASGSSQEPPPPPPSSTNPENIGSAHISKVKLRQDWWKPFKEERPATPEPAWSIRSSDVLILTNNWASALASNYLPPPEDSLLAQTDDITTFMDCVDDPILRHNVSKPLPLSGPPGQVTIQSDFFFNKDLEYLRYGSKGHRPALSISKMKAAYYHDVGLEQLVLDQFWIEEECKYDIAAMYVRRHMRILSVVQIEVFSMYGYDYMKKIVLRRADLNEHVIAERDFKFLCPSDIEDMPSISLTPVDLEMDADMAPNEQAQSSDDEDIGSAHISKVKLRQDWWKPFKEERPDTPEPAWSIRSSDVLILTNNWASALASNYLPPPEDSLLAGESMCFFDFPDCFKTLCFFNYALILRQDYDITSSLRRGALHLL
nr:hypothetical protein [Tanacetum cinerariifolium]